MNTEPLREVTEVLKHYDLGELVAHEQNERGYVNTSYVIETLLEGKKQRYFFRKYKRGAREEELDFEHSLINHLVGNGFSLAARVLTTRGGSTYVQRFDQEDDQEVRFYAIFEFLPGEDKYTWVNPVCTLEELRNSAAVLAQFHNAACGFQPQSSRAESKILDLLPIIANNVARCVSRNKHTDFDVCLRAHKDLISMQIKKTLRSLCAPACQDLVQTVIHCDYHPGNLKFQKGKIVGLFDFDWSKIDARCFDLGLAIAYFFITWGEARDGELRMNEASLFLRTYQETLQGLGGLEPLNRTELNVLPYMINAGNLYVLNWTIEDYYLKEVNLPEYINFLRHGINFIHWFEAAGHLAELEALVRDV